MTGRTRIEIVRRLEGDGVLRNAAGVEHPVAYDIVITQEVRERGSLQGRLPDARGRCHIDGTAILGSAFGIAIEGDTILRLEDGRELKAIFTRVQAPDVPSPFVASVVNAEQWTDDCPTD